MEITKYERRDGETVHRYRFRHAGKTYTGTLENFTDKKALDEAEAIRADVRRGKGRTPGKAPLLSKFIDETYLPWARIHKERTYDDVVGHCEMIKNHFKGIRLDQIKRKQVREFQTVRAATKTYKDTERANTTVNREMSELSAVFRLAVQDDLLESNPCHGVRQLPRGEQVIRFLSQDEYQRLLDHLQGEREHLLPLVQIAIFTGLRQSEQLTLRRSQIDFESGAIRLKKTKTRRARVVPMNEIVRELMAELCSGLSADDWVFKSPHPKHQGKRLVDPGRGFERACELAGVEDFTWHCLRHTFGTWQAMAGTPVHVLKELMGHTDVRTTMIYVHAAAVETRSAVERMAQWQKWQKNGKKEKADQRSASQVIDFTDGPEGDRTPDLRIANAQEWKFRNVA